MVLHVPAAQISSKLTFDINLEALSEDMVDIYEKEFMHIIAAGSQFILKLNISGAGSVWACTAVGTVKSRLFTSQLAVLWLSMWPSCNQPTGKDFARL